MNITGTAFDDVLDASSIQNVILDALAGNDIIIADANTTGTIDGGVGSDSLIVDFDLLVMTPSLGL